MICPCGCGSELPTINVGDYPGATDFIERWLMDNGLTITEVRKPNRNTNMVRIRREIAAYLHRHGWPSTQIGKYLELDHTTVLHHILKAGAA